MTDSFWVVLWTLYVFGDLSLPQVTYGDIVWLEGCLLAGSKVKKQVRDGAKRRRRKWWAAITFPQVDALFGFWP